MERYRETEQGPAAEVISRTIAAALGAALAVYGFRRGGIPGAIVGVMGAGIAVSGLRHGRVGRAIEYLTDSREAIDIDAGRDLVWEVLSDFGGYPEFVKKLESAKHRGGNRWSWRIRGPYGQVRECEVELSADSERHSIQFRSLASWVSFAGSIHVESAGLKTLVLARVSLGSGNGPMWKLASRLFKRTPSRIFRDDLMRLKLLIEGRALAADQ